VDRSRTASFHSLSAWWTPSDPDALVTWLNRPKSPDRLAHLLVRWSKVYDVLTAHSSDVRRVLSGVEGPRLRQVILTRLNKRQAIAIQHLSCEAFRNDASSVRARLIQWCLFRKEAHESDVQVSVSVEDAAITVSKVADDVMGMLSRYGHIIRKVTLLQGVQVSRRYHYTYTHLLPTMLTALVIEGEQLGDCHLEAIGKRCQQLVSIVLDNNRAITQGGLDRLVRSCPQLTHVEAEGLQSPWRVLGISEQGDILAHFERNRYKALLLQASNEIPLLEARPDIITHLNRLTNSLQLNWMAARELTKAIGYYSLYKMCMRLRLRLDPHPSWSFMVTPIVIRPGDELTDNYLRWLTDRKQSKHLEFQVQGSEWTSETLSRDFARLVPHPIRAHLSAASGIDEEAALAFLRKQPFLIKWDPPEALQVPWRRYSSLSDAEFWSWVREHPVSAKQWFLKRSASEIVKWLFSGVKLDTVLDEAVYDLLNDFKYLLSKPQDKDIKSLCGEITNLDFSDYGRSGLPIFEWWLALKADTVTKLSLKGCRWLQPDHLEKIYERYPHLQVIELEKSSQEGEIPPIWSELGFDDRVSDPGAELKSSPSLVQLLVPRLISLSTNKAYHRFDRLFWSLWSSISMEQIAAYYINLKNQKDRDSYLTVLRRMTHRLKSPRKNFRVECTDGHLDCDRALLAMLLGHPIGQNVSLELPAGVCDRRDPLEVLVRTLGLSVNPLRCLLDGLCTGKMDISTLSAPELTTLFRCRHEMTLRDELFRIPVPLLTVQMLPFREALPLLASSNQGIQLIKKKIIDMNARTLPLVDLVCAGVLSEKFNFRSQYHLRVVATALKERLPNEEDPNVLCEVLAYASVHDMLTIAHLCQIRMIELLPDLSDDDIEFLARMQSDYQLKTLKVALLAAAKHRGLLDKHQYLALILEDE